ncbi:hypothetical protein IW261DRAFT_1112609 [Armillaria novae-zelandiae]|uniref:Uncharacterized protein n=1 Tax=Armillaria novae-zelandiae TaxID=153914 RepID=A0AA39NJC0_9AGAR|nr:hypothetical protein IW261DRAFT_1112609 [Armillaria novae-zelandiae]
MLPPRKTSSSLCYQFQTAFSCLRPYLGAQNLIQTTVVSKCISLKIAKEKMLAAKRDFGGCRKFMKRRAFRSFLREMALDIQNIIASFLTAWTRHPNECNLSKICLEDTIIHTRVWELLKDCTVSEPKKRRLSFILAQISNALLRKQGYEALSG